MIFFIKILSFYFILFSLYTFIYLSIKPQFKNYLEIDIYKILSLNSHKASTIVSNNRSANPSTNVKALKKYVRDY